MTDQPARPQPLTHEPTLLKNLRDGLGILKSGNLRDLNLYQADICATIKQAIDSLQDAAKPPAVQVDARSLRNLADIIAEASTVTDAEAVGIAEAITRRIAPGLVSTPPAAQVDIDEITETMADFLAVAECWEVLDERKNIQLENSDAVKRARKLLIALRSITPAAQAPEAPAGTPGTRTVCIECHLPDEPPESPDCWAKCTVPECPIKAATDPDKGRGE